MALSNTTTGGQVTDVLAAAAAHDLGAGTVAGDAASAGLPGAAGVAAAAGPAAAAPVRIVELDTSVMTVAMQAPADAPKPLVDMTAIVDTTPPVITLRGEPFVQVVQGTSYSDAGAAVFDNMDGNALQARSRLALCRRPMGAQEWATDSRAPLACNSTVFAAVATGEPSGEWVWVYTYNAKDAAGNAAAPLRRLVEVTSRWARRSALRGSLPRSGFTHDACMPAAGVLAAASRHVATLGGALAFPACTRYEQR